LKLPYSSITGLNQDPQYYIGNQIEEYDKYFVESYTGIMDAIKPVLGQIKP
jgi:hypothetical protein